MSDSRKSTLMVEAFNAQSALGVRWSVRWASWGLTGHRVVRQDGAGEGTAEKTKRSEEIRLNRNRRPGVGTICPGFLHPTPELNSPRDVSSHIPRNLAVKKYKRNHVGIRRGRHRRRERRRRR